MVWIKPVELKKRTDRDAIITMPANNIHKLGLALIMAGSTLLTGCVGGTTYGTGVAQEQQTVEDLANILKFRKTRKVIDYKARPDLVVPEDKILVEPEQVASTSTDSDWPETPEQRIVRVRAEADEAQKTIGGQNRFARSKKLYKSEKQSKYLQEAPIGEGVPNYTCDPDGIVMRACTKDEISRAVRAQRKLTANYGKSGTGRRYLTEPPVEYRTPAATAVAGDEGYSEAELKRMEAARKLKEWQETTNTR